MSYINVCLLTKSVMGNHPVLHEVAYTNPEYARLKARDMAEEWGGYTVHGPHQGDLLPGSHGDDRVIIRDIQIGGPESDSLQGLLPAMGVVFTLDRSGPVEFHRDKGLAKLSPEERASITAPVQKGVEE
jgi:hypothetical protein